MQSDQFRNCRVLRSNYLKLSWNNTEKTRPNARCSCNGTTAYQSTDDSNKEMSQKKALAISMIILMGSAATVNVNMASGGPKARKAQPKKSITVILPPSSRDVESRVSSTFLFLFLSLPCRLVGASNILLRLQEASSRLEHSVLSGAFIFPIWCAMKGPTNNRADSFYKDYILQKPVHIGINRGVTCVTIHG